MAIETRSFVRMLAAVAAALVVATTLTGRAEAAKAYHFQDLGTLPGTTDSAALRLNNNGQVVGISCPAGGQGGHAFLWSAGVMSDLGTLGGTQSWATDINDAGTVVGYSTLPNGVGRAFQWKNGVMQDLGGYGDPAFYTLARGINANEMVAGFAYDHSHFMQYDTALRWVNGAPQSIGPLGGTSAYHWSHAYRINDLGHIVGASSTSTGDAHAFWFNGAAKIDLGTLPGGYSRESYAQDINNSGEIVGYSWGIAGEHAFRWRNGVMTDLGTLGGPHSTATSINSQGDSTGSADLAGGGIHPCLWPSTGGVIDLCPRTNAPGWALYSGNGINDSGQIAGEGEFNGHNRAFLLTPIRLVSFTLTAGAVRGGQVVMGRVHINAPAPFDLTIALSDNLPATTLPASVVIPAGGTSMTFTIATSAVSATQSGTVSVSYDNATLSRPLSVTP